MSKPRRRRRTRRRPPTLRGLLVAAAVLGVLHLAGVLPAAEEAAAPDAGSRAPSADPATCVVQTVSDGDTLRCDDGTRIRLLGIDAPETAQAPHGPDAARALREMSPRGSVLRVETDVQPRDRYGRLLAYLYTAEGVHLNHRMVREGWAVPLVYAPNVREADRLRAAADSARRERRGLWASDGFACEPRDFRAKRC